MACFSALVFFPLVSYLSICFFARFIKERFLNSSSIPACAILSLIAFYLFRTCYFCICLSFSLSCFTFSSATLLARFSSYSFRSLLSKSASLAFFRSSFAICFYLSSYCCFNFSSLFSLILSSSSAISMRLCMTLYSLLSLSNFSS